MLYSLLFTALLMGVGGLPHCAAMCAAPCAAALPRGVPLSALLGRTLGYAALGGVAAGAMELLSAWSRWAAALQPVWAMLLAATALLGAWMLFKGTMPAAFQAHGLHWYRQIRAWADGPSAGTRAPALKTMLPVALGLAWAALPCGLLYGAVTVAALAGSAGSGALVMAVFSAPGALALWWLPRRLGIWHGRGAAHDGAVAAAVSAVAPVLWRPAMGGGDQARGSSAMAEAPVAVLAGHPSTSRGLQARWSWLADPRWAVRLSGAMLCAAAGWALAQRLLTQWQVWCA